MLTSSEKMARLSFRMARIFKSYALISLFAFIFMYSAPVLSVLATLFVMVILAIIIVCTFFLIFLNPTFREIVKDTTEFTNDLIAFCDTLPQYAIYATYFAVGFALLAICATYFDKTNIKRKPMIITCSIILGISGLCCILLI